MGQIPHGERTCRVGQRREPGHVVHVPGAVVDVGERQHGHVLPAGTGQPRRDLLGLQQLQASAMLLRQRLCDVEVGGEVAALADDDVALGAVAGLVAGLAAWSSGGRSGGAVSAQCAVCAVCA